VGRGFRRRITNRVAAASSSRAWRRVKCPPGVSGEAPHFVQVAHPDYTTTALTPSCDTSIATHFQLFAENASTDRPGSIPRVGPRALPTHVSRHISFSKICLKVTYITLPPSLDIRLSIVWGSMLGNPPSLDLGARREATTSPGRRTRVRPTASRRVSGREAVNTRYDGELRLLYQPHGLRCEFSYFLCRHMLVVTVKSKHTHIVAYTHM